MSKQTVKFSSKLLERQISKHLGESLLENKQVLRFVDAVRHSYAAYERDNELSAHAFRMSEKEYIEVNERLLKAEKELATKNEELESSNEQLREMNINLEGLVDKSIKELEKSESRFRLMVETASDIIYRTDEDGFFTYANPMAIQKMGYPMLELKRMHFTDLVADNYRAELVAFYRNQWMEKIPETYKEFPAVKKNGEIVWIGQNVIFLFDDKGLVSQVSAVARDITDSKISQTRLQNLISTLQSGVLLEDENRKIALVNNTFCDMFGIEAPTEALVGTDCSGSAEQSKGLFVDEEGFVERISDILAKQETVRNDELRLKDGRVFERDYIPIFIDQHYSGHLWNYRDVTTQRSYVDAIQKSEEKYRGIIANMNLGLLEVDTDEQIRYANQSFREMSGYELDEIIGKKASDLFVRGENAQLINEKNASRKEGVSDAYEIATKNKRGEAKWWLVSGAPLFDSKGKLEGSIGIHLDISERKELERELEGAKQEAEQSSKAKETFLANMSHEIRTPMNGIVGMTRQLLKSQLDEQQQFYADTIRSAADSLLVILNDILDLSKIEAGKLDIENIPFEFEKSIKNAAQVLRPKADEKGLITECQIDGEIDNMLCGDPHRLNQVLANLLSNAIKFSDKGSVKLKAELRSDMEKEQLVSITVEDQGIGMDEAFIAKIFDKFTQEEYSTARKYGGTGLGMSITKELIELMGGEIKIESEKGKGTQISFEIPFGKVDEDSLQKEEDAQDYSKLKGLRILMAEDNELNQLVAESTLVPYEVALTVVDDGQKAVEATRDQTFDLILMDVQMPNMDGIEATKIIRNELKLDLPIIALTANVLKGDNEKYQAAGMSDHVPKPFEEEELIAMIHKWVSAARAKGSAKKKTSVQTNEKTSVYSLNKLRKLSRGNEAFVERMINVFIKQSIEATKDITTAFDAGDAEKVAKIAHKMKPSIDNLEIMTLFSVVRELEKATPQNLKSLKTKVVTLCEQLQVVLEDFNKS